MLLGRKPHAVGDRRRYVIDYSNWLDSGVAVDEITVTSSSDTLEVDGVAILGGSKAVFFVSEGELNEVATLSLRMTDTRGGIKNDTVEVFVIAP